MTAIKKITLLALLLVFNTGGFSQTTTDENLKHTLEVGLLFSPDYCNIALRNIDGSALYNQVIASERKAIKPKIGYSTGLNVCYHVSRGFAIELGVQYSEKGYSEAFSGFVFPFIQPSPAPTKVNYFYNYYYMDIPLKFNMSLGKKKLSFIGSLGLTTNLFIQQKSTSKTTYSDGSVTTTPSSSAFGNTSAVNLSPTASAGIDYRFSKLIHLRIEPTIRYGVLKTDNSNYIGSYLWNAGISVGVYFKVP
ncbi:MAG: outer membrane beta-barrel protein [Bacteroidia bacterium]